MSATIQVVPSNILKTVFPLRARKHWSSPAAFYLRIPCYVSEKLLLALIIILSLKQKKMPPTNCESSMRHTEKYAYSRRNRKYRMRVYFLQVNSDSIVFYCTYFYPYYSTVLGMSVLVFNTCDPIIYRISHFQVILLVLR